jgi:hypothetical protein
MNKFIIKILLAILLPIVNLNSIYSQTDNFQSEEIVEENGKKTKNLPYFMDDIQIIAGANFSGIFFSSNYRNLTYLPGYQVGIEKYFPMARTLFISVGPHYTQRNFKHKIDNVRFTNHYLDLPIFFSFELPEFRSIDFRFVLGTQLSYRISSNQFGEYSTETLNNPDAYTYKTGNLNSFDIGWAFGLSAEYKNIFFRLRSYIGTTNIAKKEPGTLNSFNLDVGYFIFRPFRK